MIDRKGKYRSLTFISVKLISVLVLSIYYEKFPDSLADLIVVISITDIWRILEGRMVMTVFKNKKIEGCIICGNVIIKKLFVDFLVIKLLFLSKNIKLNLFR